MKILNQGLLLEDDGARVGIRQRHRLQFRCVGHADRTLRQPVWKRRRTWAAAASATCEQK